MINLHTLLFLHVSFVFLLTNIIAAFLPNLSLIFIGFRDLWILIFAVILIKDKSYKYLSFLFILASLGAASFIEHGISKSTILVYFYGLRDLFLLVLITYYLQLPSINVNQKLIWAFVFIVFALSAGEILSFYSGFGQQYRDAFRISQYFESKGIISNLNGGLLGDRLSIPFYSPAIVCSLFSFLIFLKIPRFHKVLFLIISFYTSSKILLIVLVFKLMNRFAILILPGAVFGISFLYFSLPYVIDNFPMSIYSFHAASVLDHINALSFFNSDFLSIIPKLLGESSIASLQILGNDDIDGPESLLIARLLDFKILSIGIVFFILYELKKMNYTSRIYYMLIIMIFVFSSLSNHPIAYISFLFLYILEKIQEKPKGKEYE